MSWPWSRVRPLSDGSALVPPASRLSCSCGCVCAESTLPLKTNGSGRGAGGGAPAGHPAASAGGEVLPSPGVPGRSVALRGVRCADRCRGGDGGEGAQPDPGRALGRQDRGDGRGRGRHASSAMLTTDHVQVTASIALRGRLCPRSLLGPPRAPSRCDVRPGAVRGHWTSIVPQRPAAARPAPRAGRAFCCPLGRHGRRWPHVFQILTCPCSVRAVRTEPESEPAPHPAPLCSASRVQGGRC